MEPEAASCCGRMAPDLCILGSQRRVEREDRMGVLLAQVRSGPDSRMPEGPCIMPSKVGSAWSLGCSEQCHNE